ncbi:hypothetical protein A2U01_0069663, partial [Trifolium medium]|nr:hypothetical protein [Trifolium medium]
MKVHDVLGLFLVVFVVVEFVLTGLVVVVSVEAVH